MFLFDALSIKKDFTKVFSKENITEIMNTARAKIIDLIKENVPGPEKKDIVDVYVINLIENKLTTCSNKLLIWIVDNVVITAIPTITQLIYNFLKEKVENL